MTGGFRKRMAGDNAAKNKEISNAIADLRMTQRAVVGGWQLSPEQRSKFRDDVLKMFSRAVSAGDERTARIVGGMIVSLGAQDQKDTHAAVGRGWAMADAAGTVAGEREVPEHLREMADRLASEEDDVDDDSDS